MKRICLLGMGDLVFVRMVVFTEIKVLGMMVH